MPTINQSHRCRKRVVSSFILLALSLLSGFLWGETPSRAVFKLVKDALVIVQCNTSTGSGFVLKMDDGKTYFVTNKHVVHGQKRVVAYLLSGEKLTLGQFYFVKDTDLVRFEVKDKDVKSLDAFNEVPNVGDRVYVFGNSDGADVATDLTGTINGVGPDTIEVTVPFVHGNSGSAVLDEKGRVLGVATYATHDPDPKDWSKQDTRFKEIRRFALRLQGVEWKTMKYDIFYRGCLAEINRKNEDAGIRPEVSASFMTPKIYSVPIASPWREGFRIISDITLSMRSQKKTIKCPVVRVCVLVKGLNGKYYVRDCIMDQIGSLKHVRECPPIWVYGNSQNGWAYNIGNNASVYYLEGLSYYQGLFPDGVSRCGIKYFDKAKDSAYQLFRVSKDVCGEKPPEIVCFRLECWQNGSLAGEYNSVSPSKLNAMRIPVDWFIMNRYSHAFDYGDRGGDLEMNRR